MSTQLTDSAKNAFSDNLNRQVVQYSLAAAAASVSLLALAPAAAAEVVVTKTHLPVLSTHPISLDLNRDGVADFKFELYTYGDFGAVAGYLAVQPLTGGAVVGAQGAYFAYASALVRGDKIGPSAHFDSDPSVVVERSAGTHTSQPSYSRKIYGKWGENPTNRFLGVKFQINGATHYGWIRLTVNSDKWPMSATITGYSYETVANKRISAGTARKTLGVTQAKQRRTPDRASLGLLALGADGLALWRREEPRPS